jgi:uncharacterized membrane protein YbhN (UPF0104 family)
VAASPSEADSRGHVVLFAAGRHDPRARRPVDAVRSVAYFTLLIVAAVLSVVGHDLDERLSDALVAFPGFLYGLLLVAIWGAVAWACALLVIMLVNRRALLTAEALLAAGLALGGAACVAAIVGRSAGDVFSRLGDLDGPPIFPPALLAATWAVLATLAPRLTLPFRRVGRVLLVAQLVGALLLGASLASGAVVAAALGLLAGTALHLVFGSPGGFPTVSRIHDALHDLGIEVTELHAVSMGREGSTIFTGADGVGPLRVKVYGRDAWDGELLADLWRRTWYRDNQRTARFGRLEYVEHEGLVTVLARQAGARVPEVVRAGRGDDGDALIAVRPDGVALLDNGAFLESNQLGSLWEQLEMLHKAGIVHRRIDLDRIATHTDGTAGFNDLASASLQRRDVDRLEDQAQLIALGLVTTDEATTVQRARAALGNEALTRVLPYLQEATLSPGVRIALRRDKVKLDEVRDRLATKLDASDIELAKLRRVTWKSFLNLALLIVAAYTLIGMLSDIDLGSFWRALGDANWWWLAAALVIGQTPRVANAISTMGATTQTLPLGPTSMMQFASCYVNLAVPSSAGRVALTTRFYQRFGVPTATAVSASVIDSISEFLVQGGLFLLAFFVSDVDLGLSVNQDRLDGLATTALIILVVLVATACATLLIPALRKRVATAFGQARDALQILRSPAKLLELFGGNLTSQLLFAITLGACVRAFGQQVPLTDLILINTVVTLFAGILPIPGGVGVSEGGLSLGLTRAGVPTELALAIALSYRFVVFYLPPIWGYFSLKWMTARRYI